MVHWRFTPRQLKSSITAQRGLPVNLSRAFLAAALLVPLAAPVMAKTIAIDPETGGPLVNPPRIFLTLLDENGDAAGYYVLRDFSFRVAPNPEDYDSYLDERPRFTLTGIAQLDAGLIEWAVADTDEGSARSISVQVLAETDEGITLTYAIDDVTVHYFNVFHVSNSSEQSSATLELSGSAFSVQQQTMQSIEN